MYTITRDGCRNGLPIKSPKLEVVGDFVKTGSRMVSRTAMLIIRLHDRDIVSFVSAFSRAYVYT